MSLKYPLLEKVHINITRNPKLKVWLVVWNWSGQKSSSEIILSSLPLIISKWQKPIFCHNLSPPPYIPVQFTESSSSHYHTPHLSPHPNQSSALPWKRIFDWNPLQIWRCPWLYRLLLCFLLLSPFPKRFIVFYVRSMKLFSNWYANRHPNISYKAVCTKFGNTVVEFGLRNDLTTTDPVVGKTLFNWKSNARYTPSCTCPGHIYVTKMCLEPSDACGLHNIIMRIPRSWDMSGHICARNVYLALFVWKSENQL